MMAKSFFALVASFILMSAAFSQNNFGSEAELKTKAEELFKERKLVEASPLFAQLLSLYPQDPNYNYKYAATLLEASADRDKPLKYLKFALSKSSQVDPLAFYYMGKAQHLNYNFADAVKYYSRFKQKGDKDLLEEFQVDHQIEMAKNGNLLLSKLNEVQVLDKQVVSRKDFFRIYELEGVNGKIIVKPEDFQTKYDQKIDEKSVIFLPTNAKEVYFSSYGKKGENGRDIFKTVKLGNRSWSEPVNLGPSINTPYDENYPFIHPDGRTLYFASKGHSSMGGYDLFMSTYDQTTAQWKEPVNLDFAFSSVDDDVLFVTDKNKVLAYFASNRANEADEITVYKVMVDKAPAELSVIKGKFIAENNPDVKKAKITVIDSKTQQTVGIYETDNDGNYQVEIASNGGKYRFNVETTSDSPIHTGEVDVPRQDEFEVLGQELRLVGTGDDQQLVIKNIFDGTVAQNTSGPKISSSTLKQKALLDINFSEEALAEISRRSQATNPDIASANPGGADSQSSSPINNQSSTSKNNSQGADPSTASGVAAAVVPVVNGGGVPSANTAGNESSDNTSNNAVAENIDTQRKSQLESQMNELASSISNRSSKMNAQTAFAFYEAAQLKSQADKAFESAGVDPKSEMNTQNSVSGSDKEGEETTADKSSENSSRTTEDKINPALEEARNLASRAAIRAAIAQRMQSSSDKMNGIETTFKEDQTEISSQLSSNAYDNVEKSLDSFQQQSKNTIDNDTYLSAYGSQLSAAIEKEKSSLKEESAKLDGLKAESKRLDSTILAIESKFPEDEEPEEQAQNQLNELNLDKEDIQFQLKKSEVKLSQKQSELAALELEQSEIASLQSEIKQIDGSEESTDSLTETEKSDLISDLKQYRSNQQLAYSASDKTANDLSTPSDQYLELGIASNSTVNETQEKGGDSNLASESSPTASAKSVKEVENTFIEKIIAAQNLPDEDLQNARKIEVYDNWINELNQQADLRRKQLGQSSDPAEKQKLQDEINLLSREAANRQSEQAAIQSQIASQDQVADNSQTEIANGQELAESVKKPNEISNAGSAAQGTINDATAANNNPASQSAESISNQQKSAELPAGVPQLELSDVEASSPFPLGLNAFNFDKSYAYSAAEVGSSLKGVKTSLYQAKEYSSQAEAARSAAYTLPTVEERKQAFEDVNKYEEASEIKQVQAMRDIATVNQQEFFRNANILNNLNDYDNAEIESNNLDLANLLQDEADVYFSNAQQVRTDAAVNSATAKDEKRQMQKAYNLEMLALNKQRQALESLKLVDAEVSTNALAATSSISQYRNAQVQTITDPEILAIQDATVAKSEGDAIVKQAEVLENKAQQLKKSAEVLDIGPKRDSLLAIYQTKQDSAVQLRSKATVYYEREQQIESGFKADVATDAGILKPALVFTQTYDLDTINVDGERKDAVLQSKEYKTFITAARENQQQIRAAQIEYDKAVALRKKQFELDREAQVMLQSAASAEDATEKERRIKQARVIELKAKRLDESIDSLNKIIRIKNYLVGTSEDRMKESIASLSATQQAEIVYLSNRELKVIAASPDQIAQNQTSTKTTGDSGKPASKPIVGGQAVTASAAGTNITAGSGEVANSAKKDDNQATIEQTEAKKELQTVNTSETTKNEVSSVVDKVEEDIAANVEEKKDRAEDILNANKKDVSSEPLDDGTVNPTEVIRAVPRRPMSIASIDKVPKRMDGPIFVKLGLEESAYSNAKPIPLLNELPEGLVYKVQVGAFKKPIPQDLFKGFAPLAAEKGPNGITRYTAGLFTAERQAISARDEIRAFGYKDAFVVVFRNGERVSITAARNAVLNQTTPASNNTANTETDVSSSAANREGANTSFDDNIQNAANIDDLFFTVQVGVFSKAVKSGTFSQFKNLNAIELSSGLIRYNTGMFKSLGDAEQYKGEVSATIKDAFVVAYYNGKRISIGEAARILNQN